VKEHRNRWYVVGWRLNDSQIRVFGLDRIISGSIAVQNLEVTPPPFDAEAYLRKALGVAVYDDPAEAVILAFTREQGFRFRAQPFYPFREEDVLVDNETEFRVKLDVIVNLELVFELARLGNQVKVLEPEHLRDELTAFLSDALAQY
jgi:predicted DNA-binding transcriptional regulator YafY